MSVILVIQPDVPQARVLQDMTRRIGAELVTVDSTKKAVEAIARQVPDLILLSAFLSPRDEDTLMARLRSLEGALHLQTLTIPQFRTGEEGRSKRSKFGFGKKQKVTVAVGADPAAFADEVVALLNRASEIRNRPAPIEPARSVIEPEPAPEPAAALIEDDRSGIDDEPEAAPAEEPLFINTLVGESQVEAPAMAASDSVFDAPPDPEFERGPSLSPAWSTYAANTSTAVAASPSAYMPSAPAAKPVSSISEEIDQLVRQLGLDATFGKTGNSPFTAGAVVAPPAEDEDEYDFGAALDRARNQALMRAEEVPAAHPDAEAIRESALAEARTIAEREAREASAQEIARVQAENEAIRQASDARVAAERQAREALAADMARAQNEAEQKRELALAEARAAEAQAAAEREARKALAADWAKAQSEAEKKREQALAEARAAEARAAEERKAREALAADLARAHSEAEKKREQALAEARAAEARAAEERKAREALAADLARAHSEAEKKREQALAEARAAEARAEEERKAREALAADLARARMEAEQQRQAAIEEARQVAERELREALAADLARVQKDAEAMRLKAMTDARAAAERESREALETEVARVRSEAHLSFAEALNKVKGEAEESDRRRAEAERISANAQQAFARELMRVRTEVEQSMTAQLDAARAESERIRAGEAEAVRERAAMEAQLKNELDRLKFVSAQARKADESETKKAAQQIKHLEAELASVRAKAEERKGNELEELRAQMAEMREAAAQQARSAAAEAVAVAVAAATPRQTAVIAQFPARALAAVEPEEVEEFEEVEELEDVEEVEDESTERRSRDYLSLWQPRSSSDADDTVESEESGESLVTGANVRKHAKWALPVAACLILVTTTGSAISRMSSAVSDRVSRLVEPAKPGLVVTPMKEELPFIEVVEKRVGRLQVDSTPSGAEAILDGKSYGKTPVTIPDLEVGIHTLLLKSTSGMVTRKVTIRPNQTTITAEGIYSGWLAIFSSIPVRVVVDGVPVSLTEDSRVMATPGTHVVEFINEQFNYRVTERLDVRPGETTAHTLQLPMGTVRVTAPEGVAVLVDGKPALGTPSEGLSVPIGAHEISGRHPDLGERRQSVDVRHGGLTEVIFRFE